MQVPPEQAQAMFVRDIAPELSRGRGFYLAREQPGKLDFRDQKSEPGEIVEGHAVRDEGPLLKWLGARRIQFEFTSTLTGTLVTIQGGAERDVRDALDQLGTTAHWPEAADRPHD